MKRKKSFKVFESVDPDIVEKLCSLYEDKVYWIYFGRRRI